MAVLSRDRRFGGPVDLRDAGPASDTVRFFDPALFRWNPEPEQPKKLMITVRTKYIYLFVDTYKILRNEAESRGLMDGDCFWVDLGLAPSALAIRLSAQIGRGFKVRPTSNGAGNIACTGFIRYLKSSGKIPSASEVKLEVDWCEKNRMLVAKFAPQRGVKK